MKNTNKLLEVRLKVDAWIIEETLSRMGIPDNKNKVLYQSCHLLKQFGTYYLAHFKQLLFWDAVRMVTQGLVMFLWKTLKDEILSLSALSNGT